MSRLATYLSCHGDSKVWLFVLEPVANEFTYGGFVIDLACVVGQILTILKSNVTILSDLLSYLFQISRPFLKGENKVDKNIAILLHNILLTICLMSAAFTEAL